MMPAKLVTAREQAALAAESAFSAHLDDAVAGLARWLEPELLPGEGLPDLAFYLQLVRRVLARHRKALTDADNVHHVGKNLARTPRRERDAAATAVRDKLLAIRSLFTGLYGRARASAMLRMKGRLPELPVRLRAQARATLASLRGLAKGPLPDSPRLADLAMDPAALAGELQAAYRLLDASLDRIIDDRTVTAQRHSNKSRALRDFDEAFRRTTRLLEAHLDAAGMVWAAEKVRSKPPRRKRKVPKAPEGGEG
jgi:hypothetical protein